MPEPRRRRPRYHRPAPARLLDPILRRWEELDRRRRHIRPIRRDGVLGLEFGRHHGPALGLRDGTTVRNGDPVATLHIRNPRARELAMPAWQVGGLREARTDLVRLAAWAARQPPARRPVAYTGATLMGPFARRLGFEVRPRARTPRTRLDDWFLRWLLARWSVTGRERLQRGHGALRSCDVWLTHDALQRRYGNRLRQPPEPPARPTLG
jgi:YkoP domain